MKRRMVIEKPIVDVEAVKCWDRQQGELNAAFHAFCLYRDFGPLRNIRKVIKLNDLDERYYASWHRWSKKFCWADRAGAYDDFCDAERQKQNKIEEMERREAYKKMLEKMTGIVDKRLDSIRPEDLTAVQTMDMLERTFELGTVISTADSDEKGKGSFTGQLEINFVDTFDGV